MTTLTTYRTVIPTSMPSVHVSEKELHSIEDERSTYKWLQHNGTEKYEGTFLHSSEHGKGDYVWECGENLWSYKGQFYANYLEGYGKITYPDSTVFEGLWRRNRRYGPGVYTESNGHQNVGLWKGNRLIRLSRFIDGVPRLGTTAVAKMRLMRYRKLIPVKKEEPDLAEILLKSLNCNENLLLRSQELYCTQIREPRSMAFNKKLYDEKYFNEKMTQSSKETKTKNRGKNVQYSKDNDDLFKKSKEEQVTHVLAWNSSDTIIDVIQHILFHECFEDILSYKVEWIIQAKRGKFAAFGIYESACLELLTCSIKNNARNISLLFNEKDVYPDVSDARGNSALMFAAAADSHEAIDTLLNYGANVNYLNDEGFTPLSLCFTRYLAVIRRVQDWSTAFLPPEKSGEFAETRPMKLDTKHVNVFCYVTRIAKKFMKKGIRHDDEEHDQHDKEHKILVKITATILKLLKRGANPNIGYVPRSNLEMGIHSMNPDIVKLLIECGADPNTRSHISDGFLPVLHTVLMKPPCIEMEEIVKLLLTHGADPNITVQEEVDEAEFKIMWPQREYDADFYGAKTPLHTLCIRPEGPEPEHLEAVCQMLVDLGNANLDAVYKGLTPLLWAILKGNTRIVRALLSTHRIDLNADLPYNVGVPLSFLFSSLCVDNLDPDVIMEICDILCMFGADPLHIFSLPDSFIGNVIDYVHREIENRQKQIDMYANMRKKQRLKQTELIDMINNSKIHTKLLQDLTLIGRERVIRFIKSKVIQLIVTAVRENNLKTIKFSKIWITQDDVMDCLKILVDARKVKVTKMDIMKIFFVLFSSEDDKDGRMKTIYISQLDNILSASDTQLAKRDSLPVKKATPFIVKPELDSNETKFIVCFECVRKSNKVLIPCSKCKLVFFCSSKCYSLSSSRDTPHKCGLDIYHKTKEKYERLTVEEFKPIYTDETIDIISDITTDRQEEKDKKLKKVKSKDEVVESEEDFWNKIEMLAHQELEEHKALRRMKKEMRDVRRKGPDKKAKDKHEEGSETIDEEIKIRTPKHDKRIQIKEEIADESIMYSEDDMTDETVRRKKKKEFGYESEWIDKKKGIDKKKKVAKKEFDKKRKKKLKDSDTDRDLDYEYEYRVKLDAKRRRRKKKREPDKKLVRKEVVKGKKRETRYEDELIDGMKKYHRKKWDLEHDYDDDPVRKMKRDESMDILYRRRATLKYIEKLTDEKDIKKYMKYIDDRMLDELGIRLEKIDIKPHDRKVKFEDKLKELQELFPRIHEEILLDIHLFYRWILKLDDILLPYVVYRDGNLYYRIYGPRPVIIENYSLN